MMKKSLKLLFIGTAIAFVSSCISSCNSNKVFTVNFYSQNQLVTTSEVPLGQVIKAPADPQKYTGDNGFVYSFEGWYENIQSLTGRFKAGTQATKNANYYASFNIENTDFKVTFKYEGGTKEVDYQAGENFKEMDFVPTKYEGNDHYYYEFVKWVDPNGNEYKKGDKATPITFTAVYEKTEPVIYTAKFIDSGITVDEIQFSVVANTITSPEYVGQRTPSDIYHTVKWATLDEDKYFDEKSLVVFSKDSSNDEIKNWTFYRKDMLKKFDVTIKYKTTSNLFKVLHFDHYNRTVTFPEFPVEESYQTGKYEGIDGTTPYIRFSNETYTYSEDANYEVTVEMAEKTINVECRLSDDSVVYSKKVSFSDKSITFPTFGTSPSESGMKYIWRHIKKDSTNEDYDGGVTKNISEFNEYLDSNNTYIFKQEKVYKTYTIRFLNQDGTKVYKTQVVTLPGTTTEPIYFPIVPNLSQYRGYVIYWEATGLFAGGSRPTVNYDTGITSISSFTLHTGNINDYDIKLVPTDTSYSITFECETDLASKIVNGCPSPFNYSASDHSYTLPTLIYKTGINGYETQYYKIVYANKDYKFGDKYYEPGSTIKVGSSSQDVHDFGTKKWYIYEIPIDFDVNFYRTKSDCSNKTNLYKTIKININMLNILDFAGIEGYSSTIPDVPDGSGTPGEGKRFAWKYETGDWYLLPGDTGFYFSWNNLLAGGLNFYLDTPANKLFKLTFEEKFDSTIGYVGNSITCNRYVVRNESINLSLMLPTLHGFIFDYNTSSNLPSWYYVDPDQVDPVKTVISGGLTTIPENVNTYIYQGPTLAGANFENIYYYPHAIHDYNT